MQLSWEDVWQYTSSTTPLCHPWAYAISCFFIFVVSTASRHPLVIKGGQQIAGVQVLMHHLLAVHVLQCRSHLVCLPHHIHEVMAATKSYTHSGHATKIRKLQSTLQCKYAILLPATAKACTCVHMYGCICMCAHVCICVHKKSSRSNNVSCLLPAVKVDVSRHWCTLTES